MRVFGKVAELESFAAAARELDLSPAAVTRLVADLEDHLGARLLHRTTRRLVVTEAGAEYLKRVHDVLERIAEAEDVARDATKQASGVLRVAVSPSFATHQLAKRLPEFRRRYPLVQLDLGDAVGVINAPLDTHDVTLLIIGRGTLEGDFIARRLARTEVVACASPDYLDRHPEGRPRRPDDLLRHDCLVPTFDGAPRSWRFQDGAGQATLELTPAPALSAQHVDTLYAAALAGMGVTGLPSFIADDALREHALERLLPGWTLQTWDIHAALPTRRYLPARTRVFLDFLVEQFGGADADPWLDAAGCATAQTRQPSRP
jgi:DNA-binding transcriptional LysR family regulator